MIIAADKDEEIILENKHITITSAGKWLLS
jgi:hypothetical protein